QSENPFWNSPAATDQNIVTDSTLSSSVSGRFMNLNSKRVTVRTSFLQYLVTVCGVQLTASVSGTWSVAYNTLYIRVLLALPSIALAEAGCRLFFYKMFFNN
ncbi:MAG: hypothetical protein JXR67_03705, partial [Bacteroidales bacterium]|nr:hypothetical protein [Bacteroidales bacterium]